jgi:N-acetylglucosaminyldiphosphoundecaprenol N-acetyl-beta-D-mannosaminyltransferase
VAGSALGPLLLAAAEEAGVGVFMLGGAPGTAERAVSVLEQRYPKARLGWYCPPLGFENDTSEKERIAAAVAEFGPAIYFCGLGFPKQDRLGAELLATSRSSWFIGAGATIAFLAGEFQRAPGWMQRLGLEWVHRLVLEPRRLWRRYLRDDMTFALGLLIESSMVGLRRTFDARKKSASGV